MNNYFETQTIHWHNFSPENIIFKSNNITKKLMPEENVMSYSTKTDRDALMAKKTGEKLVTNNWGHSYYKGINHVAVHVRLTDVKKDFVCANVDFIDLSAVKNYLDVLDDYLKLDDSATIVGITATTPQVPFAVKIANFAVKMANFVVNISITIKV